MRHGTVALVLCLLTSLCLTPNELSAGVLTVNPSADARLLKDSPDFKNGLDESLSVYSAAVSDPNNVQRSLLRFDLGSLPDNVMILSAELTLFHSSLIYPTGNRGFETQVYRVTREWLEPEATWNRASNSTGWTSPGGDFIGAGGTLSPYASHSTFIPDNAGLVQVSWDIVGLVNEWYSGLIANHGLLLLGETGNGLHFYSRETTNPMLRPVLVVTYSQAVPEPSSLISAALGLAALAGYAGWGRFRRARS